MRGGQLTFRWAESVDVRGVRPHKMGARHPVNHKEETQYGK